MEPSEVENWILGLDFAGSIARPYFLIADAMWPALPTRMLAASASLPLQAILFLNVSPNEHLLP